MRLAHHLRMFLLQRRADNLARLIKAKRDRLNRPHVQSDHLIGYPVPQTPTDHGITPLYLVAVAVILGMVVYVNHFHREPAAMMACTQIAGE